MKVGELFQFFLFEVIFQVYMLSILYRVGGMSQSKIDRDIFFSVVDIVEDFYFLY